MIRRSTLASDSNMPSYESLSKQSAIERRREEDKDFREIFNSVLYPKQLSDVNPKAISFVVCGAALEIMKTVMRGESLRAKDVKASKTTWTIKFVEAS